MGGMERIATSFCSFETLVRRYTYVDKTDMLWRLVSDTEDRMFFLSRPRRFGKSLMLDTLKCIFEGKRELFRGLKIEKRRYDWKKYPVILLSMDGVRGETPDLLIENLLGTVAGLVERFSLEGVRPFSSPGRYFGEFLTKLAEKHGQYVVLIDEYDVPLQGFLNDHSAIRRVRKLMHDFYVQLKSHSGDIRFMMMTGVTNDDSIWPDNLNDLNKYPKYKKLLEDFLTPEERQRFDSRLITAMRRALGVGNVEPIARLSARLGDLSLQSSAQLVTGELVRYFSNLPFEFSLTTEADVKRHFHLFMEMLGAKVAAEEGSARGYADAIVETRKFVWVFEFKFNRSAKAAVRQIREKGYAAQYMGDKRPVTLVGVNFRTAKRNIDEPLFAAL